MDINQTFFNPNNFGTILDINGTVKCTKNVIFYIFYKKVTPKIYHKK